MWCLLYSVLTRLIAATLNWMKFGFCLKSHDDQHQTQCEAIWNIGFIKTLLGCNTINHRRELRVSSSLVKTFATFELFATLYFSWWSANKSTDNVSNPIQLRVFGRCVWMSWLNTISWSCIHNILTICTVEVCGCRFPWRNHNKSKVLNLKRAAESFSSSKLHCNTVSVQTNL